MSQFCVLGLRIWSCKSGHVKIAPTPIKPLFPINGNDEFGSSFFEDNPNLIGQVSTENNTDSDSDEENSQEENSTISTSQPGRELDESDILNQQRRRVQQPTTQLNTTPVIGSNNQFTNQSITNNIEQQVTTMDATQFNQLIAALGQLTQQLDDGGPRPMDLDYIGESRNRNLFWQQQ
ncbi:20163_t:CDS:2 [Entrophospora sp. SA101]|nr:20163_t:CDS:2 [Entrophospora sp. SA101]